MNGKILHCRNESKKGRTHEVLPGNGMPDGIPQACRSFLCSAEKSAHPSASDREGWALFSSQRGWILSDCLPGRDFPDGDGQYLSGLDGPGRIQFIFSDDAFDDGTDVFIVRRAAAGNAPEAVAGVDHDALPPVVGGVTFGKSETKAG